MARQCGVVGIEGSFDGICFYKMGGRYYARGSSCLSGKRFWKEKVFEGSRRSCVRFARGNVMASRVYRGLEGKARRYAVFCQLKSLAIGLFKEGFKEEVVMEALLRYVNKNIISRRRVGFRSRQKVNGNYRRPRGIKISSPILVSIKGPVFFSVPGLEEVIERSRRYAPV